MKLHTKGGLFALAAATGTFFFASTSNAQDTNVTVQTSPDSQPVVVQQQPTPVVVQQQPAAVTTSAPTAAVTTESSTQYTGPNRGLIATGLVTFGISYGASAIVAGTSNHQGDQHLYVPVVGPWLDIADRGSCGGVTNTACDGETTSKVLLVFDGIFQGIGVLSVIGGFVMPEQGRVTRATTETAKLEKPKVRVAPTSYGRGAPGLAMFGTF